MTVALIAGCSSDTDAPTLASSRSCLTSLGEQTPDDELDYIAEDVSGGAIGVTVGGDPVTVMFHDSEGDAKRTVAAIRLFADALEVPVDDILSRDGTVVVQWDSTPDGSQVDRVNDCLTG